MAHLQCSLVVPGTCGEVFDYLTNAQNIGYLLADHIHVEVQEGLHQVQTGDDIQLEMTRMGLTQSVLIHIDRMQRGSQFTYRQLEGLFRDWVHTVKTEPHGQDHCLVTDIVIYRLPFGLLGHLLDDLILRKDLQRILDDRLARLKAYFESVKAEGEADAPPPVDSV